VVRHSLADLGFLSNKTFEMVFLGMILFISNDIVLTNLIVKIAYTWEVRVKFPHIATSEMSRIWAIKILFRKFHNAQKRLVLGYIAIPKPPPLQEKSDATDFSLFFFALLLFCNNF
jgi:hypothetical protein